MEDFNHDGAMKEVLIKTVLLMKDRPRCQCYKKKVLSKIVL